MSEPVSLPMYDWPEIRDETNRYWQYLKQSLLDHGFKPADKLNRSHNYQSLWHESNLLLSQTCGLPYTLNLRDKVQLIGAPSFAIKCEPGAYYSVFVVRDSEPASNLSEFSAHRFGYNMQHSQSGFASALYSFSKSDNPALSQLNFVETGSHRASIKAVANNLCDIAAIDAVSWELALRHEPMSKALRVIERSLTTPALPYITALRPENEVSQIRKACMDAITQLDKTLRHSLLLTGFVTKQDEDYDVIEERWRSLKPF